MQTSWKHEGGKSTFWILTIGMSIREWIYEYQNYFFLSIPIPNFQQFIYFSSENDIKYIITFFRPNTSAKT